MISPLGKEKRPNFNSIERAWVDKKIKKWLQIKILRLPEKSYRTLEHQRNPWVLKQGCQLYAWWIWTASWKNHVITGIASNLTVIKQGV